MDTSEIITKEKLDSGTNNETIEGIILLKDCSIQTAKTGSKYLSGNLQSQKTISFKIWGNSPAFEKCKDNLAVNQVCRINGTFNEYNGLLSIVINDVEFLPYEDPTPFMESKYDGEKLAEAIEVFCKNHLSEKGYILMDRIFFSDPVLMRRFSNEFAAMSHHDNCKSGLAAHTYKVLKLLGCVLTVYKNILQDDEGQPDPDKRDLLIIGALLHDIGKIQEMNFGVYTETSFVTHRIIGLEFILEHKHLFIKDYGEMWFKHLEAIIMQHHNEYGEHCKTVYSYVVHLVDNLDSILSLIDQEIPDAAITSVGKTINVRDKRLNLF